jgi:peptidoglycan/LPS O-acetylase OafA/YrhL
MRQWLRVLFVRCCSIKNRKRMNKIMNKLKFSPPKLFLIDALGAVLTILLLSGVVAQWQNTFGMPPQILYGLSLIACFYAIFSFSCYFNFKKIAQNWKKYLKIIAIANLLYCVLTFILMIYYFKQLTFWGLLYFSNEIIVIIVVAMIELKNVYQSA